MKKRLLVLSLLIVVSTSQVLSQAKPDENFLLKRFESKITFDYLQEYTTAFIDYLEAGKSKGKTRIAVRFCSEFSLKRVLNNGAIEISAIYHALDGYGVSAKDIILLRSDACKAHTVGIVPTEFWVINQVNKLPSYEEKLWADEIGSTRIKSSRRSSGLRRYLTEATRLADALVDDQSGFGAVYVAANAETLKKQIKAVFRSRGLSDLRYSIDITPSKLGRHEPLARFYLIVNGPGHL